MSKRKGTTSKTEADLSDLFLGIARRPGRNHSQDPEVERKRAIEAGRRVYERRMRGQLSRDKLTVSA